MKVVVDKWFKVCYTLYIGGTYMFTEKEYKDAIKLCKEQLAQLGYVVPSITQFKSTTRMTRANGNHRYRRNTITGEVLS